VNPLVSVLLPARDAGGTLGAALASLVRQSERSWECVLVADAGSADDTLAIAERHAEADPRIRLVAHDDGPGLVRALQLGLGRCRAPWVARMDADDLAHRERFARQLALLAAAPELTGVGCHVRLCGPVHRRDYAAWLATIADADAVLRERFVECPLAHPTWMIRRSVLVEFGYRDPGWPEDYDLLLRLCGAGHRLGVVPRRLLVWRDSAARLSRVDARYSDARFTACKAHHLAHGPLAKGPHYVLWGYGATGRTLRRALAEYGKTPSHVIEVHPGRLGQRIHGAPVVGPDQIPELPAHPLLVSVAGGANREQIRAELARHGRRELVDFVCVA
jgi:glycosyltransferase involved in cell wall biosynthesis